jgi:hypothetical protein
MLLWLACSLPVPPAKADPSAAFDCAAVTPADGFDYPVGPPNARGYYDAQDFLVNTHLGEDWNGVGGGDSDLGDPVFAIAAGVVTEADEVGGGWGAVVRVAHRTGGSCIESLYAHFLDVGVSSGDAVNRGQVIGHIGTANGQYRAHVHLELRTKVGSELGGGYGVPLDQVDPHEFIDRHRPVRAPSGR